MTVVRGKHPRPHPRGRGPWDLHFPAAPGSPQAVHHLHRRVGVIARGDRDRRCCFVTLKFDLGDFDVHTIHTEVSAEAKMAIDGCRDGGFRVLGTATAGADRGDGKEKKCDRGFQD